MTYYSDPNQPQPANLGQQPWSYPVVSPQGGLQTQQAVSSYRPFLLALFAFPFLSLKMFLWPGPASFAREKDRVGWKAILFLLLVGAVLAGVFAYLWGRLPRLVPGIENLSAGRVAPQPLSVGVCVALAVGVPLLFLLLESILYWMAKKQRGSQRSSLRAQLYTGLLIEAPLFAFLVALALVLLYRPDLASSERLPLISVAGAFLLYSLLLHVFAVIAVHRVSAGRAMLCVALVVVILAVVVIVLLAMGESSGEKSGGNSHAHKGENQRDSSSGDKGADRDFDWGEETPERRSPARRYRLFCPNCGQQLPAALGQPGFPCPRCGTPMIVR